MNLWKNVYPIIVSCAKGLAPMTELELRRMGYEIVESTENTVVVRGGMRDIMRLNLQLRSAHRVLAPLLRSDCRNLDDLYDAVASIDWENLLEADGYFTVNSVVHNDSIRDTRMPSLVTKDAIADRMRTHCGGARPDSGPETFGASVFVYWEDLLTIIYLDTTGEPLSKRGYRRIPGTAPMQETLAAGCVLASGWEGKTPFVAPMCGSGTPAIEAALLALNRAPGSFKSHFAFMSIKGYQLKIAGEQAAGAVAPKVPARGNASPYIKLAGASPEEIWKAMVQEAKAAETPDKVPPILASDIDENAVEIAHMNAIAAGVSKFITFSVNDFAASKIPPPPGVIFMNPAYGERLGADDDLIALYGRIGDFFKQKCAGYTGCVLTGNMALSRKVGLRSKHRIPFYNGAIECRMMVYDLYAGGEAEEVPSDEEIVAELPPGQQKRDEEKSDVLPTGE
jgi:23S rRNA (guanine2445-N2)-methyltransferase / 23S rRNA (guanine2069-N7)-methyltransferase